MLLIFSFLATGAAERLVSFTVLITVSLLIGTLFGIALVLHKFVGGSDTEGSFKGAVAVAGWSYAPDLLVRFVELPLALWIFEVEVEGADLIDGMAGVFGIGFAVLIVVWSVYILTKGIVGTHDVRVKTALIPALLIGGISLVLSVGGSG